HRGLKATYAERGHTPPRRDISQVPLSRPSFFAEGLDRSAIRFQPPYQARNTTWRSALRVEAARGSTCHLRLAWNESAFGRLGAASASTPPLTLRSQAMQPSPSAQVLPRISDASGAAHDPP